MTNDEALAAKFAPLEPDQAQLTRQAAQVLERFRPEQRPLWREWFDFFAARPVVHLGYALAAAVLLGLLSPLGALPGLIQRGAATASGLASVEGDGASGRQGATPTLAVAGAGLRQSDRYAISAASDSITASVIAAASSTSPR